MYRRSAPHAKVMVVSRLRRAAILTFSIVLSREFNDPMDGLIYGRLIGLGMAVQESLLYLRLSPPTIQT